MEWIQIIILSSTALFWGFMWAIEKQKNLALERKIKILLEKHFLNAKSGQL